MYIRTQRALAVGVSEITELGYIRVVNNLNLEKNTDIIEYSKNMILDKDSKVYKANKNFYVDLNNVRLTINATTYTIITAHLDGYGKCV